MQNKTTHKISDKLFGTLFKIDTYALELAGAVENENYPKDTKVTVINLENSLLRRYNDLALEIL